MVRRPRLPGPNDIRELNRRLTQAGDDLRDAYNQLRRGGAPIPNETMDAVDEITGIPTFKITSRKEGASSNRSRPGSGGSRGARGEEELAEIMQVLTNDPDIVMTPDMVEIINDPGIMMDDNGAITRSPSGLDVIRSSGQFSRQGLLPRFEEPKKKKRKVSKYQKEFGKQLKKLKAKHPRTKITRLMKRAHTATRKAMK